LRASVFFTIDGKTAKDLDDAVCLVKTESEYILSVSIADVGHYVLQGSAIDADATDRGTSVYFPDRVIPMLPPTLSEQLCSLNPNKDKLTFTAEMASRFRRQNNDAAFYKSVLQSQPVLFTRRCECVAARRKRGDDDLYTPIETN
jgi:ribonuclease R